MNKLYDAINNLDNYVLDDRKDRITIKTIHIIYKNGTRLDLYNLKEKPLKLFYNDDNIIGYLYFDDNDNIDICNDFLRKYDDDCQNESIELIIVDFVYEEDFVCSVYWNSLFYELDNGKYILLFLGTRNLV